MEGLGYQSPKPIPCDELAAGEAGYLHCNIKTISDAKIGDTITEVANPAPEALPGFEEIKPMVFAGLYPVESHEHGLLRDALEKLRATQRQRLFIFEPENSVALSRLPGFRCGFLGLLHLEIIQERLEREFNIDLITTAPGVRYRVTRTDGPVIDVENPSKWLLCRKRSQPLRSRSYRCERHHPRRVRRRDPQASRGKARRAKKFEHLGTSRILLMYELPLNEIVLDFYDRLKSASRGYASLDYHLSGTRVSPMSKLDVLVASASPWTPCRSSSTATSPSNAARV